MQLWDEHARRLIWVGLDGSSPGMAPPANCEGKVVIDIPEESLDER
jgi:hypothetical protein